MSKPQFEALARPLLPVLYGAALRLTRNPADASDLVQETCLRAFRTFSNFRPETNAKAWLFTILHSVSVNHYRSLNRASKRFASLGDGLDDAIATESLSLYAEGRIGTQYEDWSSEIAAALEELPDGFRLAVTMVDIDELSYEDVAAIMGCPVGTVRSRVFRGRRLLCERLRSAAQQAGLIKTSEEGLQ